MVKNWHVYLGKNNSVVVVGFRLVSMYLHWTGCRFKNGWFFIGISHKVSMSKWHKNFIIQHNIYTKLTFITFIKLKNGVSWLVCFKVGVEPRPRKVLIEERGSNYNSSKKRFNMQYYLYITQLLFYPSNSFFLLGVFDGRMN